VDWENISTNLSEKYSLMTLGAEYTGSISLSGLSVLFEFKNLISGNYYSKSLPEFVEFESDPNIYLTSGSIVSNSEGRIIYNNGVSFRAESSSHVAAVPYLISGSLTDPIDIELLLQQNTGFLLLEDTSNIIIGEDGTFKIDEVQELPFTENSSQALVFERSDIKISIPAGTTTGIWTP